MHFRPLLIFPVSAIVSFVLLFCFYESDWRPVRITSDLREWLGRWKYGSTESAATIAPGNETSSVEDATLQETTLVIATMSYTDNTWLSQLDDLPSLHTAIYVADDPSAPLHPPKNKGHEAMVYLTYIIDNYHTLPPISVYLHGHDYAWHNNWLLNMSTAEMVRHLNRTKVLNDGYMNLRCHWDPGCPAHLHPFTTEVDESKKEEAIIKAAWEELFPGQGVPETLAQPCCSQFAVSSDTIRQWPRATYIHFRNWLLKTEIVDYYSGRVFEYFWQFVFANTPIFCPDPRICFCEGYGACFEDPSDYDRYFELLDEFYHVQQELEAWEELDKWDNAERDIVRGGPDAAAKGQETRYRWLREQAERISEEVERRREAAFEAGEDPERRAFAIEAAGRLTPQDVQLPPKF